jgi:putative hydrolase of the HAD superfamily
MSQCKHFSFDLWLTLLRSNPLFKQQRAAYFHEHFNRLNKSLREVEDAFRSIDIMCNAINERTGKNIDADEMYLAVISQINNNTFPLRDVDTDVLYNRMQELLFEHMPVLYSEETREVLEAVRDNKEYTASILSNTGFIRGHTLRQVLKHLDIDNYFEFQLYSDEEGMSKPNPDFFRKMMSEVSVRRGLRPGDIIHIGDNPHADIQGAVAVGIHSMLINTGDTSITKLLPYVTPHALAT